MINKLNVLTAKNNDYFNVSVRVSIVLNRFGLNSRLTQLYLILYAGCFSERFCMAQTCFLTGFLFDWHRPCMLFYQAFKQMCVRSSCSKVRFLSNRSFTQLVCSCELHAYRLLRFVVPMLDRCSRPLLHRLHIHIHIYWTNSSVGLWYYAASGGPTFLNRSPTRVWATFRPDPIPRPPSRSGSDHYQAWSPPKTTHIGPDPSPRPPT